MKIYKLSKRQSSLIGKVCVLDISLYVVLDFYEVLRAWFVLVFGD